MARCPTTHGTYRCDREVGPDGKHYGECATDEGPRARLAVVPDPPQDLDSGRELLKAVRRIEALEARAAALAAALEEIRTSPCDAVGGDASCLCCLHDRALASAALRGDA